MMKSSQKMNEIGSRIANNFGGLGRMKDLRKMVPIYNKMSLRNIPSKYSQCLLINFRKKERMKCGAALLKIIFDGAEGIRTGNLVNMSPGCCHCAMQATSWSSEMVQDHL